MNKSEAIQATKNGSIAACISAAMTVLVALIAISTDAEGKFAFFNDPSIFIDIPLVLVCAFGIYKKSRVASVLFFLYFLAAKIIISIETQSYGGIVMALVFLYFCGKAVQGSFVYHRLEKEENPDCKTPAKWTYIVGVPAVLIFTAIVGFALMSTTGIIPSTRVLASSEIKANDINTLREHNIIAPHENVDFFYAQGLSSILESGNILTQEHVILYLTDEEGLQVYGIPINEVTEVVLESAGDTFTDSIYKVNTNDPERWLNLVLSTEQKGDQKFVQALRERMNK